MKKLLMWFTVLLFTVVITGCTQPEKDDEKDNRIEEWTLTCTSDLYEDDLVIKYQTDRIIEVRTDGEVFNRFDAFADLLLIEEGILHQTNETEVVEAMDDFEEMLLDDPDTSSCETVLDMVDFIEDPEDPGTSIILENTQKDSILADALAIESAAKLYCATTTCSPTEQLTWTDLSPYVSGIDAAMYDFTNNNGVIASRVDDVWTIDMERVNTGEWEFTQDLTPSDCSRECVIEDID